jgi:hypothetical protein
VVEWAGDGCGVVFVDVGVVECAVGDVVDEDVEQSSVQEPRPGAGDELRDAVVGAEFIDDDGEGVGAIEMGVVVTALCVCTEGDDWS